MRNYVTLGDKKYLPHLICLIDSIHENFTHDFVIHVLALDDVVYDVLLRKNYDHVRLVKKEEIEEDFQIKSIRYLPPGNEAISNASVSNKDPGFVQFCWALAPSFSYWIMERARQSVTYVDADILFFRDTELFFNELGNRSVGLVRHRIPYLMTSGEFNVGIVHFEFDGPGRSALRRWKEMMLSNNHSYSLGFGTCGDQKFLEIINLIYGENVAIIDNEVGHLAPWNVTFHQYKGEKIIWNNLEQDLLYFHYAHFTMNETGYKASYENEWIWGDPLKVSNSVNRLYDIYFEKMSNAMKEISQ